jgi:hypothetical protein
MNALGSPVAASYLGLEVIAGLVIEGGAASSWLAEDRVWVWLFLASLVVFLGLPTLKKRTRLLRVEIQ